MPLNALISTVTLAILSLVHGIVLFSAQVSQLQVAPEQSQSTDTPEVRPTEPTETRLRTTELVMTEEALGRILEKIEESITRSAANFEDHLKIFEIVIAVVVACGTLLIGLASILVIFYQQKAEVRRKEEWEDWKLLWERDLKMWKDQIQTDLRSQVEKLARETAHADISSFETKFKEEIFLQIRDFMQEVVMQTPAARGLLVARFRRLSQEISSVLVAGEDWAFGIQKFMSRGIQDWHVLGQLFSSERDQLKLGLQAFRLFPIPEASDHLRLLRRKHANDSEVLTLLHEASGALVSD